MANLKEIKNRITSISSTMQITQAMKMVSAAKLKRAQDAITQLRPYAEKMQEILSNVSSTLDLSENRYAEERDVENVLLIGISSNRGLCGGFNNNIKKRIITLINEEYSDENVEILSIGKKVNDAFKNSGHLMTRPEQLSGAEDLFNDLTFEHVSEYAAYVMDAFLEGKYDKVVIVYNEFKNAASQIVRAEQMLPIEPAEEEGDTTSDYIFEPSKLEIVRDIIPKTLKLQLFKAILDSHASEHGARMTAMHKATDNATELNKDLKLEYNKARQASITNEILEIVGGAEALNG
ncbi:MAG: ATP synthase F1 subunit gamma [Bacteroidota bacterium]